MTNLRRRSFYPLRATLQKLFTLLLLPLLTAAAASSLKAQTCDNQPEGSGESISAEISISDSGVVLHDNAIVHAYTNVRIDSVATAFGQCIGMAWNCQNSPCVCQQTGTTYERTVNHTSVSVDISSTGLNGNYFVGNVYGQNPDHTTAFWHVLDTHNSNSTGPLNFLLSYPGTYQFHIQAFINTTPCNMQPDETETLTITIEVGADDDAPNNGATACPGGVGRPPLDPGRPVNVTNGNMYLQQTDYRLPGIGDGLEIRRTYNSKKQTAGLFGYGWSSILDESVVAYGNSLLRLNLEDGRAVYLARTSTNAPFNPVPGLGFYGQII